MHDTFRHAMAWLHTWTGVVLGSVLFAVFWMGTLSVFDEEIDRWMMPGTRISAPAAGVSLDQIIRSDVHDRVRSATRWSLGLPTERRAAIRFSYRVADGERIRGWLDPNDGSYIPAQGTMAATGFIFPFHFRLYLRWRDLGEWIVGAAGMAMLLLLVSGVVIHRKLFKEFFTFRPARRLQRSALDLHNLTGVLGLPFHVVITLSGLVVFINVYFPEAPNLAYAQSRDAGRAFSAERYGGYSRKPAGKPGESGSLDAMVRVAQSHWSGSPARDLQIWFPGDANSYVEVRRGYGDTVTATRDKIVFDGATGDILYQFRTPPMVTAHRFISGMHFIEFDHWPLRWLYFVGGLSGCMMIATGYLFWMEARRRRHATHTLRGVRIVEGLTIGSVTGIVIATLAFFVSNRLLPTDAAVAGFERAELEIWAFHLAWLAGFAHAWIRPRRAWAEQCWAIAGFATLAVALNAATTGDHLLKTLASGSWPVAGMDLMLLAGAASAALTASSLARRRLRIPVDRDQDARAAKASNG